MMVSTLLTKIGVPVLAQVLAESLGGVDHPAARGAARALGDLDDALTRGQITPEQIEEANRHAEKMAELRFDQIRAGLEATNKSLRAEIGSNDAYVRRMRPTFGYLMALTWAAQMFGLAYVIVFRTDQASLVLQAMESLGLIWAVGLSVLGVYVYKRSEDKKLFNFPERGLKFFQRGEEATQPPVYLRPDISESKAGDYWGALNQ